MNRHQLNDIISDINVVGIIQDYMSGETLVPKLVPGESMELQNKWFIRDRITQVVKEKLWRLETLRNIERNASLIEYYLQFEDLPAKYARGDIWR